MAAMSGLLLLAVTTFNSQAATLVTRGTSNAIGVGVFLGVQGDTNVFGGTTRNSILTIWAELGTHGLEPDLGSVKQNWIGWVIQVNAVKVILL